MYFIGQKSKGKLEQFYFFFFGLEAWLKKKEEKALGEQI